MFHGFFVASYHGKSTIFVGIMKQDQIEFDTKVAEIQNEVTAFDQNTDAGAYEEVAKQARILKEKLDNANAQAKRYNNQELLTNEEETSYDNIKQMLSDFTPFYDLWTTTDLWKVQM